MLTASDFNVATQTRKSVLDSRLPSNLIHRLGHRRCFLQIFKNRLGRMCSAKQISKFSFSTIRIVTLSSIEANDTVLAKCINIVYLKCGKMILELFSLIVTNMGTNSTSSRMMSIQLTCNEIIRCSNILIVRFLHRLL